MQMEGGFDRSYFLSLSREFFFSVSESASFLVSLTPLHEDTPYRDTGSVHISNSTLHRHFGLTFGNQTGCESTAVKEHQQGGRIFNLFRLLRMTSVRRNSRYFYEGEKYQCMVGAEWVMRSDAETTT
eukprot:scaffold28978_cov51-Attheya_sp.AAC.2